MHRMLLSSDEASGLASIVVRISWWFLETFGECPLLLVDLALFVPTLEYLAILFAELSSWLLTFLLVILAGWKVYPWGLVLYNRF
jgi:hypothetical protein